MTFPLGYIPPSHQLRGPKRPLRGKTEKFFFVDYIDFIKPRTVEEELQSENMVRAIYEMKELASKFGVKL